LTLGNDDETNQVTITHLHKNSHVRCDVTIVWAIPWSDIGAAGTIFGSPSPLLFFYSADAIQSLCVRRREALGHVFALRQCRDNPPHLVKIWSNASVPPVEAPIAKSDPFVEPLPGSVKWGSTTSAELCFRFGGGQAKLVQPCFASPRTVSSNKHPADSSRNPLMPIRFSDRSTATISLPARGWPLRRGQKRGPVKP